LPGGGVCNGCQTALGPVDRTPSTSSRLASRLAGLPQPEREVLDLEVLLHAPVPTLAADAGLLDAAERRLRRGRDAVVETYDAVLEGLGDAEGTGDVVREDVSREAVGRVVRE